MRETQAVTSLRQSMSDILQDIGPIETYFPRIYGSIPVAGKPRKVLKSLFPRYFFARFVWDRASRYIASRPNVIGIVQFGEFPSIVSDKVIEELKSWSINLESEVFDPTLDLNPGQRVLIKFGPFKGMEAEFLSHLNDQKRVALLLDHLQSRARLIMDRFHLRLV
jgi:transcription antitermination factor NusG